jgi:hypothetical protein
VEEGSNLTSLCILAAVNPPLDGRNHNDIPIDEEFKGVIADDFKGFKDRQGAIKAKPDVRNGVLFEDLGMLVMAPNPYYKSKNVFVFVGCYSKVHMELPTGQQMPQVYAGSWLPFLETVSNGGLLARNYMMLLSC